MGNIPNIPLFLNRLLSLTSTQQDVVFTVFERYLEEQVNYARQNGTFDAGMETIRANRIEKTDDKVVHTDERTGAQTRYVELDVTRPVAYTKWGSAKARAASYGEKFQGWFMGKHGRLDGSLFGPVDLGSRIDGSGNVVRRGMVFGIRDDSTRYISNVEELKQGKGSAYNLATKTHEPTVLSEPIEIGTEKKVWNELVEGAPKEETTKERMIVGVILPIWDRIKGSERLWCVQTQEGEQMIGAGLRLLEKGDEAAVRADKAVPKETHPDNVPSERLAYLIEQVTNADEAARKSIPGAIKVLVQRALAALCVHGIIGRHLHNHWRSAE